MKFFLKKIIPLIFLFSFTIFIAFFYQKFYIENLTSSTIKKYETIREEILNLVEKDDNLKKLINQDRPFLNEIFKKYLPQKLLLLLVHDSQGNNFDPKMFANQPVSKNALDRLTPYINNPQQVNLIEPLSLAFLTLADFPGSGPVKYTFVFELKDYLDEKENFNNRFKLFFPFIFIPLILLSLLILGKNKLVLIKDYFMIRDITVLKKKSQIPQTSQQEDLPFSSEEPSSPNSERLSLEKSNQELSPTEKKLIQILSNFFLKRELLTIYPYYYSNLNSPDLLLKDPSTLSKNVLEDRESSAVVRDSKKILEDQYDYKNLLKSSFRIPEIIHSLNHSDSLLSFLNSFFSKFTQHHPEQAVLILKKKSDIFKLFHLSPSTLERTTSQTSLKEIVSTPFIGMEQPFFHTGIPYMEDLQKSDYVSLCFPLLNSNFEKEYILKILLPKKQLNLDNRYLLHQESILLNLGINHFSQFPEKKIDLDNWFNKDYFQHLLSTYHFKFKKFLFQDNQSENSFLYPQEIIKLSISSSSQENKNEKITNIIWKQLKQKIDEAFPDLVFALQKETQTLWALTFNSQNNRQPISINFEKELNSYLKKSFLELYNQKIKFRINNKTISFPIHDEDWKQLKKNYSFWNAST